MKSTLDKIYSWFKPPTVEEPAINCGVPKMAVMAEKTKRTCPITEIYKKRPAPEREQFNEVLHSAGFVAEDGILRVFYNEHNVAVELEVNGLTLNLREAKPFPYHARWGMARDLIRAWMRDHEASLTEDFGWVRNVWK
jgi:hypothetical protein